MEKRSSQFIYTIGVLQSYTYIHPALDQFTNPPFEAEQHSIAS